MSRFREPIRLEDPDFLKGFASGVETVDAWIRSYMLSRSKQRDAVVYASKLVSADRVAGIYTLSSRSLRRDEVGPSPLRRNAPRNIPVILLGILAVDIACQGMGLGTSLLRDAVLRCAQLSRSIGVRAIYVDAENSAVPFYLKHGFRELKIETDPPVPGTVPMYHGLTGLLAGI